MTFDQLRFKISHLTRYSRLLVQHPRVLFKLRCEIRDAVGVGDDATTTPTISKIKTLPYLSLVLKEGIGKWPRLDSALEAHR